MGLGTPNQGGRGHFGVSSPSACGPPPPLNSRGQVGLGEVRSGRSRLGEPRPLAASLLASFWISCSVMGGPGLSGWWMLGKEISWKPGNISGDVPRFLKIYPSKNWPRERGLSAKINHQRFQSALYCPGPFVQSFIFF